MTSSLASVESALMLAGRATGALGSLGTATDTTEHVAQEMQARADTMQAASRMVTENVRSVSLIVDENARSSAEMGITTASLTSTLQPMGHAAQAQCTSAEAVAASTSAVRAQIAEVTQTAHAVHEHATDLQRRIDRFQLGAPAAATARPQSAVGAARPPGAQRSPAIA